eukprot:759683-Hanusia_phi.AAC.5
MQHQRDVDCFLAHHPCLLQQRHQLPSELLLLSSHPLSRQCRLLYLLHHGVQLLIPARQHKLAASSLSSHAQPHARALGPHDQSLNVLRAQPAHVAPVDAEEDVSLAQQAALLRWSSRQQLLDHCLPPRTHDHPNPLEALAAAQAADQASAHSPDLSQLPVHPP